MSRGGDTTMRSPRTRSVRPTPLDEIRLHLRRVQRRDAHLVVATQSAESRLVHDVEHLRGKHAVRASAWRRYPASAISSADGRQQPPASTPFPPGGSCPMSVPRAVTLYEFFTRTHRSSPSPGAWTARTTARRSTPARSLLKRRACSPVRRLQRDRGQDHVGVLPHVHLRQVQRRSDDGGGEIRTAATGVAIAPSSARA